MTWRYQQRSPRPVSWSTTRLPAVVFLVFLSVPSAEAFTPREVCMPDSALMSGLQTTLTAKNNHVVILFLLEAPSSLLLSTLTTQF
ncbi:hypothetical protein G6F22_021736 [Rhizopus arrhizus]|nr:hypothetical protein G6F22_021736 [Rhizopus arrhizus]KAG1165625.1 hypothetical protein G6F35_018676 [Rhizopus arrhizus]